MAASDITRSFAAFLPAFVELVAILWGLTGLGVSVIVYRYR